MTVTCSCLDELLFTCKLSYMQLVYINPIRVTYTPSSLLKCTLYGHVVILFHDNGFTLFSSVGMVSDEEIPNHSWKVLIVASLRLLV